MNVKFLIFTILFSSNTIFCADYKQLEQTSDNDATDSNIKTDAENKIYLFDFFESKKAVTRAADGSLINCLHIEVTIQERCNDGQIQKYTTFMSLAAFYDSKTNTYIKNGDEIILGKKKFKFISDVETDRIKRIVERSNAESSLHNDHTCTCIIL